MPQSNSTSENEFVPNSAEKSEKRRQHILQKELEIRAVAIQLSRRFDMPQLSSKQSLDAPDNPKPSPEEKALKHQAVRSALTSALATEDSETNADRLHKIIQEWKSTGDSININAIEALGEAELEKFIAAANTLLSRDAANIIPVVKPSPFTAEEVARDVAIFEALAEGNDNHDALIDALRKQLDQWTLDGKPTINMEALRSLRPHHRALILAALSKACAPSLKNFIKFPSPQHLPQPHRSEVLPTPRATINDIDIGQKLSGGDNGTIYWAREAREDAPWNMVVKVPYGANGNQQLRTEERAFREIIATGYQHLCHCYGFLPHNKEGHLKESPESSTSDKESPSSDESDHRLLLEHLAGRTIEQFASLMKKKLDLGEITLQDYLAVSWRITLTEVLALKELASKSWEHGDPHDRNAKVLPDGRLKLFDLGNAKRWTIPAPAAWSASSQNPLAQLYPWDSVTMIVVADHLMNTLFKGHHWPDFPSLSHFATTDLLPLMEDARQIRLRARIFEEHGILLGGNDLQRLTLDMSQDEIKAHVLPSDWTPLPTEDGELAKEALENDRVNTKDEIDKGMQEVHQQLDQFVVTSSLSRFLSNPFLEIESSRDDVHDFGFLVDTPHDEEHAIGLVKKIYALEAMITTQFPGERNSVYNWLGAEAVRIRPINGAEDNDKAELIAAVVEVLRNHKHAADIGIKAIEQAAATIIDSALALRSRIYNSVNYIDFDGAHKKTMFLDIEDRTTYKETMFEALQSIGKQLIAFAAIPVTELTPPIFSKAIDSIIYHPALFYGEKRNYADEEYSVIDQQQKEFRSAVIDAVLKNTCDVAYGLRLGIEEQPELKHDVDALLEMCDIGSPNSASPSPNYFMWREIAIRAGIADPLPQNQITREVQGHNDGMQLAQMPVSESGKFSTDAARVTNSFLRMRGFPHTGGSLLPSSQPGEARRHRGMMPVHLAEELATLDMRRELVAYANDGGKLQAALAGIKGKQTELEKKLNARLQSLNFDDSFSTALVQLNPDAIDRLESTYQDYVQRMAATEKDSTAEPERQREKEALEALRFSRHVLMTAKDLAPRLWLLLEAKQLQNNPEKLREAENDIQRRVNELEWRVNAAVDADALWAELQVELAKSDVQKEEIGKWIDECKRLQNKQEGKLKQLSDFAGKVEQIRNQSSLSVDPLPEGGGTPDIFTAHFEMLTSFRLDVESALHKSSIEDLQNEWNWLGRSGDYVGRVRTLWDKGSKLHHEMISEEPILDERLSRMTRSFRLLNNVMRILETLIKQQQRLQQNFDGSDVSLWKELATRLDSQIDVLHKTLEELPRTENALDADYPKCLANGEKTMREQRYLAAELEWGLNKLTAKLDYQIQSRPTAESRRSFLGGLSRRLDLSRYRVAKAMEVSPFALKIKKQMPEPQDATALPRPSLTADRTVDKITYPWSDHESFNRLQELIREDVTRTVKNERELLLYRVNSGLAKQRAEDRSPDPQLEWNTAIKDWRGNELLPAEMRQSLDAYADGLDAVVTKRAQREFETLVSGLLSIQTNQTQDLSAAILVPSDSRNQETIALMEKTVQELEERNRNRLEQEREAWASEEDEIAECNPDPDSAFILFNVINHMETYCSKEKNPTSDNGIAVNAGASESSHSVDTDDAENGKSSSQGVATRVMYISNKHVYYKPLSANQAGKRPLVYRIKKRDLTKAYLDADHPEHSPLSFCRADFAHVQPGDEYELYTRPSVTVYKGGATERFDRDDNEVVMEPISRVGNISESDAKKSPSPTISADILPDLPLPEDAGYSRALEGDNFGVLSTSHFFQPSKDGSTSDASDFELRQSPNDSGEGSSKGKELEGYLTTLRENLGVRQINLRPVPSGSFGNKNFVLQRNADGSVFIGLEPDLNGKAKQPAPTIYLVDSPAAAGLEVGKPIPLAVEGKITASPPLSMTPRRDGGRQSGDSIDAPRSRRS